MDFAEFLQSKKIDPKAFKSEEPELYQNFQYEFEQCSPASFTARKLYLINPIRRKYHLSEEPGAEKEKSAPAKAKVQIKRPTKPNL